MLHLEPTSGLWQNCKSKPQCSLPYHAPVKEGEISYSLLMETYASEELLREPDFEGSRKSKSNLWTDEEGLVNREYGLPARVPIDGVGAYLWVFRNVLLGRCIVLPNELPKWEGSMLPAGAKDYMSAFVLTN